MNVRRRYEENAKNGLEKSGKALETAKTMGYTKIIREGKKMGIHMKKYINTSFEQADKALYEAKRSGKNRVCCAKSAE